MDTMYDFLLDMWVFSDPEVLTEERLMSYVAKGFIELKEAQQIIATPRKNSN